MARQIATPFGPMDAVADWLRANGVDPCDVPIDGPITITHGRIHYDALLRNRAGRLYRDPATDDAARAHRWALLRADPPSNVQVTVLI